MELELSVKYQPLFEILSGKHPNVDTVVITGGRNSQKSFAVGTWSCIAAKDCAYNILYTRYTLTAAEDSIIPEFNEKIDLLNAHSSYVVTRDRINGVNGSKIVFKGIKTSSGNQTASLKSLKDFNVFVLEEAEEMPSFDTWDKIKKSIRSNKKQNVNILILNPTTKTHWIYTELFEDRGVQEGFNGTVGNVMYIHSSYLDMPRHLIADNLWTDFEDKRLAYEEWIKLPRDQQDNSPLKKKAKYYKHTIMGGWLEKSEGVIFENWEIGEFKESDNMLFGSDWGFSNDPTTLVEVSIEKSAKRIYLREKCYKTRMTTDDIASMMKRECGSGLIIADSAEPRLINELQKRGLNVKPAIKGQGSIKEGIALMLDYDLIISPDSTNLIKELNNYSWSDKKSETPIDAHNHCFIGSTLISTINGQKPIKDINVGDFVLTRNGYKKVLKKFDNGIKKVNRYLMHFDTFSVYLCSTDNHLIYTNEKWQEISKLKKGMTIDFNKHLMELHTSYTEEKNTLLKANGVKVQKECTSLFGNTTMAKYQKDITSIIKMKTHGTTELTTSNASHKKNTLKGTKKKYLKGLTAKSNLTTLKKLGRLQKNGINQKRVDYGILNTLESTTGGIQICQTENVMNAKQHTNHRHIIKHFAQTNVNLGLDASQELIMKPGYALYVDQNIQLTNIQKLKLVDVNVLESWYEEVFDIMVEDEHEYFANGVLVHNCIDASRYAISHALTQKERVIDFGWG